MPRFKQSARRRRQKRASYRRHAAQRRAAQNAKNWRDRDRLFRLQGHPDTSAVSEVSALQIERPTFITERLHKRVLETWQTAEELIAELSELGAINQRLRDRARRLTAQSQ